MAVEPGEWLSGVLARHAPVGAHTEPHLRAVVADSVVYPGRRLRAQLVLAAAGAHGLSFAVAERLACAVEYYHLASLLLDDLPCMDDATLRRGRICPHHRHGEASVILAALAFINRAYALLGQVQVEASPSAREAMQALLDTCLGVDGILGGQARDLRFAESDRSAREVARVAWGKTGALFRLAVQLPALLVAPVASERRALQRLCLYWSLAYQAADDLNDAMGAGLATGKAAHRDRALGRPNLALVLGVPAAQRRLGRLLGQAAGELARLGQANNRWGYLQEFHERCFFAPGSPAARPMADRAA